MSRPFPLQHPARVIIAHGRLVHVRADDGSESTARADRRDPQVVCGDRVRCDYDAQHDELHVVALEPRTGALYRSNARGGSELIAANLTLIVAVVAPLPVPDFYLVDRYLCAAQCAGIAACIVLNKMELGAEVAALSELQTLAAIGYPCLQASAGNGLGLAALRTLLQGQTAVLVGQSGVGKSSLLRALVPGSVAPIGALIRDDEGRHTTTTTRLFELPDGGALIDSPGVRDFAPAIDRLVAPALGFRELAARSPQCRFADCQHLREPDCAVRRAVEDGTISARRYESYRRLHRLAGRLSGSSPSAGSRRGR
ncbi:MAG TPA: ribosome small subunit-dependent GTPase A [Steroidobacteraceae bacterium]|nr:ribosome small subunit-dependent GTPase A [Steroidobacteraceae bacterium]